MGVGVAAGGLNAQPPELLPEHCDPPGCWLARQLVEFDRLEERVQQVFPPRAMRQGPEALPFTVRHGEQAHGTARRVGIECEFRSPGVAEHAGHGAVSREPHGPQPAWQDVPLGTGGGTVQTRRKQLRNAIACVDSRFAIDSGTEIIDDERNDEEVRPSRHAHSRL